MLNSFAAAVGAAVDEEDWETAAELKAALDAAREELDAHLNASTCCDALGAVAQTRPVDTLGPMVYSTRSARRVCSSSYPVRGIRFYDRVQWLCMSTIQS